MLTTEMGGEEKLGQLELADTVFPELPKMYYQRVVVTGGILDLRESHLI